MRPRLLAIESEPDIARMLTLVFPADRYRVRLLRTFAAGRRALPCRNVDLVLLEPVLPDGDGLVLCREIRRARRTLPIVVVTSQTNARKAARAAGATAFVAKPFEPDALRAKVDKLLGGWRRSRPA